MFKSTYTEWIHEVAEPIKSALWNKWATQGAPRTSSMRLEDIQVAVLSIEHEIAHIEKNVHTRQQKMFYTNLARQAVRKFFELNFHQPEYIVRPWDRIKDLTPGVPGKKDTDLPLIDDISNQHGTQWYPLPQEEMKDKINQNHFPERYTAPTLLMLNQAQAIPVQLVMLI